MKFQPSAIAATNLSGKSGGTVATITNTFRRKSNPRQPNSSYQIAIRERFATYSTGWGVLTEEQQDAWIAAAPNFIFFKHGEAYTLKGNTLYQKVNNNLVRAGQAEVATPPTPAALPIFEISNLIVINNDGTMEVTMTMNTEEVPDGYTLIAVGTTGMPPGRRSFQNKFNEMPGATASDFTIDAGSAYNERYTAADIGKRVGAGAYLINNSTGQTTNTTYLQALVTGP